MTRSPIRYTFCEAPFHYPVQCEHSLNIIVEGYSILMYLFGFMFTVLYIQLSSLLPQKQVYTGPHENVMFPKKGKPHSDVLQASCDMNET